MLGAWSLIVRYQHVDKMLYPISYSDWSYKTQNLSSCDGLDVLIHAFMLSDDFKFNGPLWDVVGFVD